MNTSSIRGFGLSNRQAARDYLENCTVQAVRESGLARLLVKYEEGIKSDPAAGEFVSALLGFMETRDREIIGLKGKLVNGGREDLLDSAAYLKHQFSKKLAKDELSESVQRVYAHILSIINTTFAQKVRPLILEGAAIRDVDSVIFEEIYNPIYDDIACADIGLTMDHVRGMLFYLTGKCHIRWDK